MIADWSIYFPAHWTYTVSSSTHSFGPFVFGAPQNWTADDAVEPDGEYPPDPPKCADCKGEGKVTLFTGVVDCETCDGSGY